MTSESNRVGSIGKNYVQRVVLEWGWGFQDITQENDDGYDGLIYIRKKEVDEKEPNKKTKQKWNFTGGMIHVQIKSGKSYISSENELNYKIKISNLADKKLIWNVSPFPCILVFTFEEKNGLGKGFWADLKSSSTYMDKEETVIVVPKKNRFSLSIECNGPLRRLVKYSGSFHEKPLIDLSKNDSLKNLLPAKLNHNFNRTVKESAIDFYQSWKLHGSQNPYFGEIIINRTGWSHITRSSRPVGRVNASFILLPAAARILNDVKDWRSLKAPKEYQKKNDPNTYLVDFIGITARVKWKERGSSDVMVVLKRETKIPDGNEGNNSSTKIWFYTVYEPGRNK